MNEIIDNLVFKATQALEEFMSLNQEQVDKIIENMAIIAMENHVNLAKLAIEETQRGILEDKIIKNMFASEYIFNNIKHKKTVGIINNNKLENYIEIAEPLGVIAGVTPVTNPSSTVIFKCLICAKTRNPIIFAFHPGAQKTCVRTVELLKQAGIQSGAPENFIQYIESPSLESTHELINHPGVHTVLATGGSGMVKSAYSTGKPALGVGPGNVPCYIEKTADLQQACTDLILSKTFDNGMICASEQSVIIDEVIAPKFEKIMTENNNIFIDSPEDINKLSNIMINQETGVLNPKIVGKSAYEIAKLANINIPENTKIILVNQDINTIGEKFSLSLEKLSPVLSYYKTKNTQEAFKACKNILKFGGLGHTACIHSNNQEIIEQFGLNMNACRIITNSPSSHGAIGDIYNNNTPSLTLGCGSHGKNSVSTNISCENLINTKKIFFRRNNMQWFKIPPKIYFEKNSISYLENIKNISRVLIVTDQNMIDLEYLNKINYYLNKNRNKINIEVFSDIKPDPDFETVLNGWEVLKKFNPDCILALGGGSVIDAAKSIWLLSSENNINFDNLKLKFMDIRKRIYEFPDSHRKIKFIAIPTTSGTGSEVTSFAVITDNKTNIKYPLADYNLTPDIAIIDPNLVLSLPKIPTADTGIDVLTHAIEAYVSTMSSDYTDGLCLQAIEIIFEYLVRSYKNGALDPEAREKIHNASCIAGMAFTNSFLGLNHSMAHKIGAEFNISHGRSNAILLPYIIKYNASLPEKFVAFPKYNKFVADEKYLKISKLTDRYNPNSSKQENIQNLILYIQDLNKKLDIPVSFKEFGISEEEFLSKIDKLSELAHQDQCTGTNPRYPLISEIKDLYLKSYYGEL
ncbi:MAG: bifunctional acetaldehyde-CoA/alcohol dehydrogenase [Clostridia bacterium]|nr:bifunctional acetaldehyde-CoA/alcohol dehydrogenase [Clostridia bacterium]